METYFTKLLLTLEGQRKELEQREKSWEFLLLLKEFHY